MHNCILLQFYEMISLGDTAISLHTLQLQLFGGGGYFWLVKTQSAKFCPTFYFWEGGFHFWRGQGGYSRIGYSWQNKQKFYHAKLSLASQIVSHTLRVWRLTRKLELLPFVVCDGKVQCCRAITCWTTDVYLPSPGFSMQLSTQYKQRWLPGLSWLGAKSPCPY